MHNQNGYMPSARTLACEAAVYLFEFYLVHKSRGCVGDIRFIRLERIGTLRLSKPSFLAEALHFQLQF